MIEPMEKLTAKIVAEVQKKRQQTIGKIFT